MIKKGAGSSGGMVSVQGKDKPAAAQPGGLPMPVLAGGGALALCVIGYLVFGGSSKPPAVAADKASETKVAEFAQKKLVDDPKPQIAAADLTPKNPVEGLRKDESRQELATAKPEARAFGSERRVLDDKPAQQIDRLERAPIEKGEKSEKVEKLAQADRAGESLDKEKDSRSIENAKSDAKRESAPDIAALLGKKENSNGANGGGASDAPAAAAAPPGAPAGAAPAEQVGSIPKAPVPVNPLSDDTPDDPFNRDKTQAPKKPAAPNDTKVGAGAGSGKAPAAIDPKPLPPRAAFVRGKSCDLFPAGTSSRTDEIVDPRNNKQTAKIDRYEGWIFNCQQLTGLVVKDGEASINHQALLQLDRFPDLEYKLQFEMKLGPNAALAIQTGSVVAVSNLLIITDTHALPGTWDTAKTDNNVKGEDHQAKPHGVKDAWIPVQLSVHADSVDCVFGGKAPVRFTLPKTATFAQLGFMTMGLKGNKDPNVKIRKATLLAP